MQRNNLVHNATPNTPEWLINLRPAPNGLYQVAGAPANHPIGLNPAGQQTDATIVKAFIHHLPEGDRLVAIRLHKGSAPSLSIDARETNGTEWQQLATLPLNTVHLPGADGADSAEGMTAVVAQCHSIDFASLHRFLIFNTPALHIFRFDPSTHTYLQEQGGTTDAPLLVFRTEGQWSAGGETLTFSIPARGENMEGCYFRESADGQYHPSLLNASNADSVVLHNSSDNSPKKWGNISFSPAHTADALTALAGQYTSMQTASPYHREGYILLCTTWQLADGTFSTPSEPVVVHLGCHNIATDFRNKTGESFNALIHQDVLYNRDKIHISQFSADSLSATTDTPVTISASVRRQWMQKVVCSRPPQSGSAVYRKAVVFASLPISMYDIAKADFNGLHTIHHYGLQRSTLGLVEGNDYYFRLALSHPATACPEGLPEVVPGKQELADAILFKALEWDLTDPLDTDDKTIDFSTLATQPPLNTPLNSHFTLQCGGLMTYNERLHIWNVGSNLAGQPIRQNTLSTPLAGWRHRYTDTQLTNHITERHVVPDSNGNTWMKPNAQLAQNSNGHRLTAVAQCRINDNGKLLYHYRTLFYDGLFENASGSALTVLPPYICFPHSMCDELTLYVRLEQGGEARWVCQKQSMVPSNTCNMSYGVWHDNTEDDKKSASPLTPTPTDAIDPELGEWLLTLNGHTFSAPVSTPGELPAEGTLRQPDQLLVSAPNNPYSFPPELAFNFGHDISAVEVQTREISTAQTGQWPTCVFTDGGIFSLSLGSTAFYSHFTPISAEINTGAHVLGTPFGIVFLAAGGVKLLQGRNVINLSEAIFAPIDATLHQCRQWKDVLTGHPDELTSAGSWLYEGCQTDGLASLIAHTPNIGTAQQASDLPSRRMVHFAYSARHHELLFSIPISGGRVHPLTYVYSFPQKQWWARTEVFLSFQHDMALEWMPAATVPLSFYPLPGTRLVSLNKETAACDESSRPVVIQSRPFAAINCANSRAAVYSGRKSPPPAVIGNLVVKGSLSTSSHHYAILGLLGSNDGVHWELVALRQWKHPQTPQILLERSHRSWRFHAWALLADATEGFKLSLPII